MTRPIDDWDVPIDQVELSLEEVAELRWWRTVFCARLEPTSSPFKVGEGLPGLGIIVVIPGRGPSNG